MTGPVQVTAQQLLTGHQLFGGGPSTPLRDCVCGVPNLTVTEGAAHQAAVLAEAGLLWHRIRHQEGVCDSCGCEHIDGPRGMHCPWCDPDPDAWSPT